MKKMLFSSYRLSKLLQKFGSVSVHVESISSLKGWLVWKHSPVPNKSKSFFPASQLHQITEAPNLWSWFCMWNISEMLLWTSRTAQQLKKFTPGLITIVADDVNMIAGSSLILFFFSNFPMVFILLGPELLRACDTMIIQAKVHSRPV